VENNGYIVIKPCGCSSTWFAYLTDDSAKEIIEELENGNTVRPLEKIEDKFVMCESHDTVKAHLRSIGIGDSFSTTDMESELSFQRLTSAQLRASQAMRFALDYRRKFNDLKEDPATDKLLGLVADLEKAFLCNLTSLFESFEPSVQAENKALKELLSERVRLCNCASFRGVDMNPEVAIAARNVRANASATRRRNK